MYSIISPDPGTRPSQKFAALSVTGNWDRVLSKADCRKNGASVRAKATCVTSIPECKRRFRTNFNKEVMTGVFRGVIVPPKGSGKQPSVDVDWSFGSEINRRTVEICNVQLSDEESGPSCQLRETSAEQSQPRKTQTERRFFEPEVICVNNDRRTSPHSTKWVEEEINHSVISYCQKPGLRHTLQGSVMERIRAEMVFALTNTSRGCSQCIISNQLSHYRILNWQ